LEFASYTDLSTRLVLLPLNDEECTGAVIGSHVPQPKEEQQQQQQQEPPTSTQDVVLLSDNKGDTGEETSPDEGGHDTEVTKKRSTESTSSTASNTTAESSDDDESETDPSEEQPHEEDGTDETDAASSSGVTEHRQEQIVIQETKETREEGDSHSSTQNDGVASTTEPTSSSNTDKHNEAVVVASTQPVVGLVLCGIVQLDKDGNEDSTTDWKEEDFSEILSCIRDAPFPLTLVFCEATAETTEKKEESDTVVELSKPNETEIKKTLVEEKDTSPGRSGMALRGRLSQWGSVVRTKSTILANEASARALSAVEVAREAAEKRAKQREEEQRISDALKKQLTTTKTTTTTTAPTTPSTTHIETSASTTAMEPAADYEAVGMFLQTSAEGFVPLTIKTHNDTSLEPESTSRVESFLRSSHVVTNLSMLSIRLSAEQACPARGYRYQWYRSYCKKERSASMESTHSRDSQKEAEPLGWFPLIGATYAIFQPSATDVGHWIKCVVTIKSSSNSEVVMRCELVDPISADAELFKAAKQSLRGGSATFTNLTGRGNAERRSFCLKFSRGGKAPKDEGNESTEVTCSMSIYQVSGRTAEPLHDAEDLISNPCAVADPSQPKSFDLIFLSGLPKSSAMLPVLCEDNGSFQLTAPNRVTRETFLLTLGIARYSSKSSDLSTKSVLFPSVPRGVLDEIVSIPESKDENTSNEPRYMATKETADDARNNVVRSTPAEDATDTSFTNTTGGDDDTFSEMFSPQSRADSCRTSEDYPDECFYSPESQGGSQVYKLELELQRVRTMLADRDRTVTDLQRNLSHYETKVQTVEHSLSNAQMQMRSNEAKYGDCFKSLKLAEKRVESHETILAQVKRDGAMKIAAVENEMKKKLEDQTELEKVIKVLENEKAVMAASIEARDSKLQKMASLQDTVDLLSAQSKKYESVRAQLNDMEGKYENKQKDLELTIESKEQVSEELEQTKTTIDELSKRFEEEKEQLKEGKREIQKCQMASQTFKAERNSAKQKAESLSKEMARVHKTSTEQQQKWLEHEIALNEEISSFRKQKRDALEELEESRSHHILAMQAHHNAGIDGEAVRAVGQRAELEHVVAELTEYVNAQEMQLETMRAVNRALTEELAATSFAPFCQQCMSKREE